MNGHHLDLGEIVLVVEDGRAGDLLEAMGSGDVVDVGVGDDDLLDGEVVLGKESEDAGDVMGMSSPGSTTMASREVSSPRMEQLHWSGPTGMVSRIMIFPD